MNQSGSPSHFVFLLLISFFFNSCAEYDPCDPAARYNQIIVGMPASYLSIARKDVRIQARDGSFEIRSDRIQKPPFVSAYPFIEDDPDSPVTNLLKFVTAGDYGDLHNMEKRALYVLKHRGGRSVEVRIASRIYHGILGIYGRIDHMDRPSFRIPELYSLEIEEEVLRGVDAGKTVVTYESYGVDGETNHSCCGIEFRYVSVILFLKSSPFENTDQTMKNN